MFCTMAEICKVMIKISDWCALIQKKTASYVTNRSSCTCQYLGSNEYSAVEGTRIINIQTSGSEFVRPTNISY